jgi:hypothetical protein
MFRFLVLLLAMDPVCPGNNLDNICKKANADAVVKRELIAVLGQLLLLTISTAL